jgi:hypothetical protein
MPADLEAQSEQVSTEQVESEPQRDFGTTEAAPEATPEPATEAAPESAPEQNPRDWESELKERDQKLAQYESFWAGDGRRAWDHYQQAQAQQQQTQQQEQQAERDSDEWELVDAVTENRTFRYNAEDKMRSLEGRLESFEQSRLRDEIERDVAQVMDRFDGVDRQKLLSQYARGKGTFTIAEMAAFMYSPAAEKKSEGVVPPRENLKSQQTPADDPRSDILKQLDGSPNSWELIEEFSRTFG